MMDEWGVLARWVAEIVAKCPKALHAEAAKLDRDHAALIAYRAGGEDLWASLSRSGTPSPEAQATWRDFKSRLQGRWQAMFSTAASISARAANSLTRGRTRDRDHKPEDDDKVALAAGIHCLFNPGTKLRPAVRAKAHELGVKMLPNADAYSTRISKLINNPKGEIGRRLRFLVEVAKREIAKRGWRPNGFSIQS